MTDYTKIYKVGQQIKYRINGEWMHAKIFAVRMRNVDVCIFRHVGNLVLKNCTDYHIGQ
jgi:hypothetical protein